MVPEFENPKIVKIILPLAAIFLALGSIQAVEIRMGVKPGLKFDVPAFHVQPSTKVTLTFKNNDEMMHNIVFTQPGKRMLVVEAAIAMGAEGLEKHFVPGDPSVLAATPIVQPGQVYVLEFNSPSEPGEYPYVCTFPGHGFVMHGTMFVAKERPGKVDVLIKAAQSIETEAGATLPRSKAKLMRTFMPDSSPAAIAVALPGGHSYCWDAGNSTLRYVWRDGFIRRNGSYGRWRTLPTLDGQIYYREPSQPFRFKGEGTSPELQFKGYRFIDGIPEFRFQLGNVEFREFIAKLPGKSGILRRFKVTGLDCGLEFHKDPLAGVEIASDKGIWEGDVLHLSNEEANAFTLELTEIPGKAPVEYWSMDDLTTGYPKKGSLVEGRFGRAWQFKSSPKIPTIHSFSNFENAFALSLWLKVQGANAKLPSICGWGSPGNGLILHYDGNGQGLQIGSPTSSLYDHHGHLEAEDADVKGPATTNKNAGHTGTGYVDYNTRAGESIEWKFNNDDAGEYMLRFRYAVAGGDRPLDVGLNGKTLVAKAPFNDSGGWESWVNLDIPADLKKGMNSVKLTSIGSGPNVDSLSLVSKKKRETQPPPKPVEPPLPKGQPQLKSGSWHHVVVNSDGQEAKFYVDGKIVGTPQGIEPGKVPPSGKFYIGTTNNGTPFHLDGLRLYRRTLDQKEIQELMKR